MTVGGVNVLKLAYVDDEGTLYNGDAFVLESADKDYKSVWSSLPLLPTVWATVPARMPDAEMWRLAIRVFKQAEPQGVYVRTEQYTPRSM